MTPRELSDAVIREAPLLSADEPIGQAVNEVVESGLPALPVVEGDELVGIFGEREFITALFPGYLKELNYAGFVPQSLDRALEKRSSCRVEPVKQHMNAEHVEVEGDYSDAQLAENFLHHRVLIIPVVQQGRVTGVITRSDFFRVLAERFAAKGEA
jgi:CBS domain-containing protein